MMHSSVSLWRSIKDLELTCYACDHKALTNITTESMKPIIRVNPYYTHMESENKPLNILSTYTEDSGILFMGYSEIKQSLNSLELIIISLNLQIQRLT